MKLKESQLYEAFGLEQPEDPHVPSTPPAEPEEQQQNLQQPGAAEVADNTDDQDASTAVRADPEQPEEQPSDGEGEKKPPLTPEQRRENAARRRQQEQQAAIEQALQEERQKQDQQMKEFFSKAGLVNTATGKPITNMEEFQQWQEASAQEKLQKDLKAGKLTPEALQTAISAHPVVQQAQQLLQQHTQEQQAQQRAAAEKTLQAELEKIQKVDASIKTLEDLFSAPYGAELYQMAQSGYKLSDAHFLLNKDKLQKAQQEAARQQVLLNNRGKDHLHSSANSRGGGTVPVPADIMQAFRQFNPKATEAEIIAYYNKSLKK